MCWAELMENLHAKGDSIQRLTELHAAYVSKIQRKCLVHSEVAVAAVDRTLSTILQFCAALSVAPAKVPAGVP